jgi:voltage-gated potassium channel
MNDPRLPTNTPAPQPSPPPPRKRLFHPGAFRYSAIELLAVLVLLFFTAPFIEDLPGGDLLESVLMTAVMVSSVLAVGGRRRTLLLAVVLLVPAFASRWLAHLFPGVFFSLLSPVAGLVFFVFVVIHLIRFILRAPQVDSNVLCAGLSGYMLLGLLWVPCYVVVAKLDPRAFNLPSSPGASSTMDGFTAFYFSFITLSTVGYGDVTPVSRWARMLAVMEAIAGLFYVAVLISRLVAIYSAAHSTTDEGSDPHAR